MKTKGRNIKILKDFIIPYDDSSDLPLSPQIYHQYTQPAHDHFHPNVRNCSTHEDVIRRITNRGRVLLLIYPPPGSMALETVKAYANIDPEENDTIVYCGEGIGGANANNEFFDYFLDANNEKYEDKCFRYKWCVMKVMDVLPAPGGKGYEKMFVMKRLKVRKEERK